MIIRSEAGADREDQAAIRTNVVCNAVANGGVHVGNAQGQYVVAGFRPDGPVPLVAALGARPRSHASVSVADLPLQRQWRVGVGGGTPGIGTQGVGIGERALTTPRLVQTNHGVYWHRAPPN